MPVIKESFTIQRPLFDVFKLVTDYEQYPTLLKGISNVHITSGDPLRAGSMVSMVRGGIFINADVLDYQRHKTITLKGIWGRFRFTRTQEFSSSGAGATQVKDSFEVQTGFIWFWYAPIVSRTMQQQMRADWAAFKLKLGG